MRFWFAAIMIASAVVAGVWSLGAPLAADGPDVDARIRAVMADLERSRRLAISPADGEVLLKLIVQSNAKRAVEIGTFRGYSALWLAMGLHRTGGTLTTYEIEPEVAAVAVRNFARAGVAHIVTQVVGDAHVELAKLEGPIDFAFIDADKAGYYDYLQKLLPLVRPGGLIVAHNVRYPPPDPRFMEAISTDPRLETTFANMDEAGIGISRKVR